MQEGKRCPNAIGYCTLDVCTNNCVHHPNYKQKEVNTTREIRCEKCNKLLFKIYDEPKMIDVDSHGGRYTLTDCEKIIAIEAQCPRCKEKKKHQIPRS